MVFGSVLFIVSGLIVYSNAVNFIVLFQIFFLLLNSNEPSYQKLVEKFNSFSDEQSVWKGTTTSNATLVKLKQLDDGQFMKLMEERRQRVISHCNKYVYDNPNLLTPESDRGMILMLPERNFIWCLVPKSASTDWNLNIVKLSGRTLSEKESKKEIWQKAILVSKTAKDKEVLHEILNSENHASLMIVRHPFDRIVSAFRDKLERICPTFDVISKNIASKWRAKAVKTLGREFFDGPLSGASLPVNPPSRRWKQDKLASFWEFVQELVNTSPTTYDVHWKPISLMCNVCQPDIDYNYILHLEGFKNEEPTFIRHMGWTAELGEGLEVHNANKYQNMTKFQITRHYFKDISRSDIQKLYEIYRHDFEMFGYDANHILP